MKIRIFEDIPEWTNFRKSISSSKSLGVVMTMGALHRGHRTLIERSKKENDLTVVTIYLNPTQFNNENDLDNYPSTWDDDVKVLECLDVDFLLAPRYDQIYQDDYRYVVTENDFSKILCGGARPGHFDGVLTVVMKLLNITKADRAYFGEKDYQQFHLIKGMRDAFFIDTEIIPCAIAREKDNLALSSRNKLLTAGGRKLAAFYAKAIRENTEIDKIKLKLENNNIKVDYLEERYGRRFAAVFIDDVRLIDNFDLKELE
ncbi:MAG TPA: pantoate--beta-alanine ligase [Victivallales bacterium]|nr:pantoate--beta-alanine ligase [Victivallales bacterium]